MAKSVEITFPSGKLRVELEEGKAWRKLSDPARLIDGEGGTWTWNQTSGTYLVVKKVDKVLLVNYRFSQVGSGDGDMATLLNPGKEQDGSWRAT